MTGMPGIYEGDKGNRKRPGRNRGQRPGNMAGDFENRADHITEDTHTHWEDFGHLYPE